MRPIAALQCAGCSHRSGRSSPSRPPAPSPRLRRVRCRPVWSASDSSESLNRAAESTRDRRRPLQQRGAQITVNARERATVGQPTHWLRRAAADSAESTEASDPTARIFQHSNEADSKHTHMQRSALALDCPDRIVAMRPIRRLLPLLCLVVCAAVLSSSVMVSARRSHHAHKHGHGRRDAPEEFSAAHADPHIYRGATAKPLPNPLPVQDMPGAFSWCNTPSGRSFCGPSWNQHIPTLVHSALSKASIFATFTSFLLAVSFTRTAPA